MTWLRALDSGDTTVRDLSRITGLSVRRVQERLQRARLNREVDEVVGEVEAVDDEDKLPYLPITDTPERERRDYYDLRIDAATIDRGRVRIGDHNGRRLKVRSVNGGIPIERLVEDEKPKKQFKPRARVRHSKKLTPEEVAKIKAKGR